MVFALYSGLLNLEPLYAGERKSLRALVTLIMSFPHPDSIFHVGDGKHVDNVTESSRGKVGVFDSKLLLGKPEGFMSPAGLLE